MVNYPSESEEEFPSIDTEVQWVSAREAIAATAKASVAAAAATAAK